MMVVSLKQSSLFIAAQLNTAAIQQPSSVITDSAEFMTIFDSNFGFKSAASPSC